MCLVLWMNLLGKRYYYWKTLRIIKWLSKMLKSMLRNIIACPTSSITCSSSISRKKGIKVGLICSRGGHLLQLYLLKDWWKEYNRFWVTGRGEDSSYLLRKEIVYFGYFPEHRNILNAIKNLFLAFKIIFREKPDLLVSTGAGIAPPFFLTGKILGCHLIFLDSYSFIKYPSISARMVSFLSDKVLVQHQLERSSLKNAEYWGSIL